MPRSKNSPALRQVGGNFLAAHEAGHAVVAVVLRLSLQYATLRPRGAESGLTHTRNLKNETPNYLEREAVCALAGIAADRVLNGRLTFGSAMGDVPHVRRIADRLGVADVEGFLRHKLRTAEEFVVLNREAVEEVARLLIERRTLPGYEVRRIVMTQGNPAPLGDSNRGQPRT